MAPELHVKGLNSSAVKVTWTYSTMLDAKQFHIELKRLPGNIVEHSEVASSDTREVTFTGLGEFDK